MMKENVLVFGASGFIGTYLIDTLVNEGFNVVASDKNSIGKSHYKEKNVSFIQIDITQPSDFEKLAERKVDIVINLAATQPANVSIESYDPKDYINVNVNGTLNILDYCKNNGIKKVVYASSHRNTQGLWSDIRKAITEEDGRSIKYSGQYSMFSISETAAQDCVLHYNEEYGLQGVIFRLPPVYGYGPHTEIYFDGKPIKTGFQIFMEKARACEPLEVWGDWNLGRDIIYIKDVVSAFMKVINMDCVKGLYNITSGKKLSLKEEAETIAKVFWGTESEPIVINVPEKSNHIDSFQYDISKAKNDLGWEPVFSFEEMLYDFIKESDENSFNYLVKKRQIMFESSKI